MKTGDQLGPFQVRVTREQLVRYAGAADDYNPIHYDDALARRLGLPGVIVHGMLNMGLIARFVLEALPPLTSVVEYQARFRQMVQPEELLTIRATVARVDGTDVALDVVLHGESGRPAVTGSLHVRLPRPEGLL
ncbi:MAG: MaoC/PaaZ C-terminal domain-containing protein [Firmicutes bacterium]|nr:MaoC/PaaZ C-terminal domain-containing protein [Bacillota bacterium]